MDLPLFNQTLETRRLARHAIRKAFEAQRDFDKSCAQDLEDHLHGFIIRMTERALRGYERL